MIFETFFVSLAFNWSISLSNHETQIHFLWLSFSQICIMANLHEAMSFPQLFAVGIFRGYLPWLSAVGIAVGICRGYLPWEFAVGFFCLCKQTFFLCQQIFFLCKQTFFVWKQNIFFIYESFFVNSASFCYCHGSYGPPYFCLFKKNIIHIFWLSIFSA